MTTEEYVKFTSDMLCDYDADAFVEALLVILGKKRDRANPQVLFDPAVLTKLAHVKLAHPQIFHGQFAMALRPRKALYDELMQAMRGMNGQARAPADDDLPVPQTMTELLAKDLPEPVTLIDRLLHEGMLLFGGKSKRGKSWLMVDLALSVATGRCAMRHEAFACRAATPVLYLALEDGERRVKTRALEIQPNLKTVDTFHLLYEFPPLAQGGVERLARYIERYAYKLVIIDVLAKLEPPGTRKDGGEKSYHEVYQMFAPLQDLRTRHPFCLAMLTHLRKQDADDVFDTLTGSVGYQGAQDVLWVLERKPKDNYAFLYTRDKDAEDQVHALHFTHGHWEYIGEGEEFALSRTQRTIIQVLMEEDKEMSIREILRAAEMPDERYGYLRKLLMIMVQEDLLHRTRRGNYAATLRGTKEYATPSEYDDDDFI